MKTIIVSLLLLSTSMMAANIDVITDGTALVNGQKLTKNTVIKYGDNIETKKGASFRFNIGKEAFLVNEKTKFSLNKEDGTNVIDLVSGSIMGTFSKGKHQVKTPNMTAGIRGTVVFALVKDNKSYFCICYGATDINAHQLHDEIHLEATHRAMVWITPEKVNRSAKMEFHTDDEIRALDKMVGRTPKFDK